MSRAAAAFVNSSTGKIEAVETDNPLPIRDITLEIARGNIAGVSCINKFGRSTNLDTGVATDIWDGANPTDDIAVWVPPTAARIHQIVSTDVADDATVSPTGLGALTIRIFGLTSWNTAEVSEDITMAGTTDVPTVNAYVIIHRMQVLTKGSTSVNVGVITATADTDGTTTAQIRATQGQTQMTIYGIPSIQVAFMTNYYASILKANLTTTEQHVDMSICFNPEPEVELTNYRIEHTGGIASRGSNPFLHEFTPYKVFAGPGILKMSGTGSAINLDMSAGFDLILVNN